MISGPFQNSTEFHRNTLNSQWISMEFNEIQWNSMEFNRFKKCFGVWGLLMYTYSLQETLAAPTLNGDLPIQ